MHGLIVTSLQRFLTQTYGSARWDEIRAHAGLPEAGFESMLDYPETMFDGTLRAAAEVLGKDQASLLEDMGTFLISASDEHSLRRLLRFSGANFLDFLNALEDLPGRARLAVPSLDVPALELVAQGRQRFHITYLWHRPDGIHVIAGILRAMADDYGALAVTEVGVDALGDACLQVSLLDRKFAEGRGFELGALG